MKRRRVLTGIGALVGAGSLAFGTGAFTSVSAERAVAVDVADDSDAFLQMEPIADAGLDSESTGRSGTFGEEVWFSIPGNGPGENSAADGVGVDSVYEFHDLLHVTNQGTQPVQLHSTYEGDKLADLALVNDGGVLRDDPPTLDVGDGIDVGLRLDTHGASTGEFEETLTIVADQPEE